MEKFWVWKTVTLGIWNSPDEYRGALERAGHRIYNKTTNDLLSKTACSQQRKKVDLVKISVKELTQRDGAHYEDIVDKAVEIGLELCPAEVGPALRLACCDDWQETCCLIAMKPIGGGMFSVVPGRCEARTLNCYGLYSFGQPNRLFWNSETPPFMFVCPEHLSGVLGKKAEKLGSPSHLKD